MTDQDNVGVAVGISSLASIGAKVCRFISGIRFKYYYFRFQAAILEFWVAMELSEWHHFIDKTYFIRTHNKPLAQNIEIYILRWPPAAIFYYGNLNNFRTVGYVWFLPKFIPHQLSAGRDIFWSDIFWKLKMVADEILKIKKIELLFICFSGWSSGLIRGPIIAQNGSKDAEW